jgi:methylase of polypeptide subunit release factors
VFIPQYDTEGIIDLFDSSNENGLEVGPGTGVISTTLSLYKNKTMTSIDINRKAVELTASNAGNLGVLMNSKLGDIFKYNPKDKFDFLVSNPPYIDQNDDVEE